MPDTIGQAMDSYKRRLKRNEAASQEAQAKLTEVSSWLQGFAQEMASYVEEPETSQPAEGRLEFRVDFGRLSGRKDHVASLVFEVLDWGQVRARAGEGPEPPEVGSKRDLKDVHEAWVRGLLIGLIEAQEPRNGTGPLVASYG